MCQWNQLLRMLPGFCPDERKVLRDRRVLERHRLRSLWSSAFELSGLWPDRHLLCGLRHWLHCHQRILLSQRSVLEWECLRRLHSSLHHLHSQRHLLYLLQRLLPPAIQKQWQVLCQQEVLRWMGLLQLPYRLCSMQGLHEDWLHRMYNRLERPPRWSHVLR